MVGFHFFLKIVKLFTESQIKEVKYTLGSVPQFVIFRCESETYLGVGHLASVEAVLRSTHGL